MPEQSQKLAKLNALRLAYGESLPQRVEGLWRIWGQIAVAHEWGPQHAELLQQAHSLAGSAGTFGFRRVSELAKRLEQLLTECARSALPCARHAEAQQLLLHLKTAARRRMDESVGPLLSTDLLKAEPSVQHPRNLIGLVEDDVSLAQEVADQLGLLGWDVRVYHSAAAAAAAFPDVPHAALIVDVMLPEGRLSGVSLLEEVKAHGGPPCVMISARWDWEARLAAVQAGAVAYLVKPVDIAMLDEQLDRMTQRGDAPPYRVLVMDDDAMLAEHYAHTLTLAGMDAISETDPSCLLNRLVEHQTELVLMDLHMPGCSGIEVARVIRQDPKYFSLPIVFLTTESGFDRQQQAMQAGADDFLCKPISDTELLFAVSVRAERFRSLNKLVRQDSMTGLLNHLAFKQRLEVELERAHRSNKSLSLVMLDIDHFKKVNDQYGHPQGDRVIRTLAHLLRKRLRKSDIIGRYGGEEFAVLMPDTPLDMAYSIVETLRQQFAGLNYAIPHGEFTCTFSAGMAVAWPLCDPDGLVLAADQALYLAKQAGRNQIYRP